MDKGIVNLINSEAEKCTLIIENKKEKKIAVITNKNNIKDVIEYPKTQSNQDIVDDLVIYFRYARI